MNSFRWFLAAASLVVLAFGLPPAKAEAATPLCEPSTR
jgi:hypothetical protein